MTDKQEKFCLEYLVDLNATQAAIRAGYAEANAGKQGSEILGKTRVAERIAELRKEQAERTLITADNVLRELALLGFANMEDYISISPDGGPSVDLSGLTREQAAAISAVQVEDSKNGRKVKFKLHDKRTALVDLGKHLGIFNENNAPGIAIQINNDNRSIYASLENGPE